MNTHCTTWVGRLGVVIAFVALAACGPAAETADLDSSSAQSTGALTAGKVELVSYTSTVRPTQTTFYKIYLPTNYVADGGTPFPVMMFLVGSGETGVDPAKLDLNGPLKTIKNNGGTAPADAGMDGMIFVVPNNPKVKPADTDVELMKEVYDIVMRTYNADRNRFYLTGLSLGGNGVHIFNNLYPGLTAASVVLSAGDKRLKLGQNMTATQACAMYGGGSPVWIVHGNTDTQSYGITVANATWMYDTLNACNAVPAPRYSLVGGYGHSGTLWNDVYANAGVTNWKNSHALVAPGEDPLNEAGVGSVYTWAKQFSLKPVAPFNVALGKVATASTTYLAYTPDKAFDGDSTTNPSRWISDSTVGPHALTVALGTSRKIVQAVVKHGYGNDFAIANFDLEYFNGTSWLPMPGASVRNNPLTGVSHTFTFTTPVVATQVRLVSTDAARVRVKELELWGN